jgi:hypothetical protein
VPALGNPMIKRHDFGGIVAFFRNNANKNSYRFFQRLRSIFSYNHNNPKVLSFFWRINSGFTLYLP